MERDHRLCRLEARVAFYHGGKPTMPSAETVTLLDAAAEHKAQGGSLEDVPRLKAALDTLREKEGT